MAIFTENPMYSIMLGLLFTGGFAAFSVMLQSRTCMVLSVISFLTMVGLVVMERSIETDNEKLRSNTFRLAELVANNDLQGAKRYFSKKMLSTINQLETEMPDYNFRSCRITGFRPIEFDSTSNPTKAQVDFTVIVNVDASIRYQYDGVAQRGVLLNFEKESDGEWRIVNYSHYDPRNRGL